MIISEMPESEAACANMQTQNLVKSFWGVKVSPIQPVTVSFHNRPRKNLYVCQATLGELCFEAFEGETDDRSLVSMQKGDNPKVLFCSLRMRQREMTRLDIVLEGPGDVVFSVEGPFHIHLVGYVYDDPAIHVVPPPVAMGQGSPELFVRQTRKSKRLRREEVREQVVEEEDHIRAANDGPQTATYFEDNSIRSAQHGLPENSEVDTKDAKRAKKKRKKNAREEARSTMNGSPEYHALQSRKSETLKKHKNHDDDEDEDDQIRYTKHDSLQNPLLDSKEAKRLKKKLKKRKHAEDDDTRDANDGLQMPTYSEDDSMRSAQHGLPEDSTVDSGDTKTARKKKKDAKEEVRAANDGIQTHQSKTVQTKKHIVKNANIRSHEAGRVIVVCALPCLGKR